MCGYKYDMFEINATFISMLIYWYFPWSIFIFKDIQILNNQNCTFWPVPIWSSWFFSESLAKAHVLQVLRDPGADFQGRKLVFAVGNKHVFRPPLSIFVWWISTYFKRHQTKPNNANNRSPPIISHPPGVSQGPLQESGCIALRVAIGRGRLDQERLG